MENTDFKLTYWSVILTYWPVILVIFSNGSILNAHIFTFQLTSFKSFLTYWIFFYCKILFKCLKPVYIHFSVEYNKLTRHLEASWGKCKRQVHRIKWTNLHESKLTRRARHVVDICWKLVESKKEKMPFYQKEYVYPRHLLNIPPSRNAAEDSARRVATSSELSKHLF